MFTGRLSFNVFSECENFLLSDFAKIKLKIFYSKTKKAVKNCLKSRKNCKQSCQKSRKKCKQSCLKSHKNCKQSHNKTGFRPVS
jgi:hypothetical protein